MFAFCRSSKATAKGWGNPWRTVQIVALGCTLYFPSTLKWSSLAKVAFILRNSNVVRRKLAELQVVAILESAGIATNLLTMDDNGLDLSCQIPVLPLTSKKRRHKGRIAIHLGDELRNNKYSS